MRAIGELDQNDAQIAHHRQQHLAKAFGLRFLAALEANLIELGNAIDNFGNAGAKAGGNFLFGDRRVFHDIVQNRGDDGVRIEAQLGENFGGGHRVRDVRLTGLAFLALVRVSAKFGGGADALHLLGRQVLFNLS